MNAFEDLSDGHATYAFLLLLSLGLQSNPDVNLSPNLFLLSSSLRQVQLQLLCSESDTISFQSIKVQEEASYAREVAGV